MTRPGAARQLSGRVRPSPRIAWQVVGGEAIVLDVTTGLAVGLNEVGTFIWKNLETLDREQLVENIVREFAVDRATAKGDLETFLDRFVREGVLQEIP